MAPQPCFAFISVKDFPPLKHPIVLVHGSTANGSNLSIGPFNLGTYFEGLPQFLSSNGTVVKLAQLPTDASIAERASVLKNFLETELQGQMVNLVGHSIGGLDARYLASVLGSTQISSITTIGTPHRGTPLADWAWSQTEKRGVWYWIFRLLGFDMKQRRFLPELTTHKMRVFNEKVPDSPEVRYFSVATRSRFEDGMMSVFLWPTSRWLEGQGHPLSANGHDGMVPFDSQVWGISLSPKEIDHLAQLNHHEFRIANNKVEAMQLWYNVYENLLKQGH